MGNYVGRGSKSSEQSPAKNDSPFLQRSASMPVANNPALKRTSSPAQAIRRTRSMEGPAETSSSSSSGESEPRKKKPRTVASPTPSDAPSGPRKRPRSTAASAGGPPAKNVGLPPQSNRTLLATSPAKTGSGAPATASPRPPAPRPPARPRPDDILEIISCSSSDGSSDIAIAAVAAASRVKKLTQGPQCVVCMRQFGVTPEEISRNAAECLTRCILTKPTGAILQQHLHQPAGPKEAHRQHVYSYPALMRSYVKAMVEEDGAAVDHVNHVSDQLVELFVRHMSSEYSMYPTRDLWELLLRRVLRSETESGIYRAYGVIEATLRTMPHDDLLQPSDVWHLLNSVRNHYWRRQSKAFVSHDHDDNDDGSQRGDGSDASSSEDEGAHRRFAPEAHETTRVTRRSAAGGGARNRNLPEETHRDVFMYLVEKRVVNILEALEEIGKAEGVVDVPGFKTPQAAAMELLRATMVLKVFGLFFSRDLNSVLTGARVAEQQNRMFIGNQTSHCLAANLLSPASCLKRMANALVAACKLTSTAMPINQHEVRVQDKQEDGVAASAFTTIAMHVNLIQSCLTGAGREVLHEPLRQYFVAELNKEPSYTREIDENEPFNESLVPEILNNHYKRFEFVDAIGNFESVSRLLLEAIDDLFGLKKKIQERSLSFAEIERVCRVEDLPNKFEIRHALSVLVLAVAHMLQCPRGDDPFVAEADRHRDHPLTGPSAVVGDREGLAAAVEQLFMKFPETDIELELKYLKSALRFQVMC